METINKKFLSAKEAAYYLGFSLIYLYELTSQAKITFYRPGGKKMFFLESDLDEWILSKKNKSRDCSNG